MSEQLIERINEMENILNSAREAVDEFEAALIKLRVIEADAARLFSYYGSDEWFAHRDKYATGEIPRSIPCGILSEDAIFDLLTDYTRLIKEMKNYCDNTEIVK